MLTEASHITLADGLTTNNGYSCSDPTIAVCRSAVPKWLELDINDSVPILATRWIKVWIYGTDECDLSFRK